MTLIYEFSNKFFVICYYLEFIFYLTEKIIFINEVIPDQIIFKSKYFFDIGNLCELKILNNFACVISSDSGLYQEEHG
jgi:hypothetical protein